MNKIEIKAVYRDENGFLILKPISGELYEAFGYQFCIHYTSEKNFLITEVSTGRLVTEEETKKAAKLALLNFYLRGDLVNAINKASSAFHEEEERLREALNEFPKYPINKPVKI